MSWPKQKPSFTVWRVIFLLPGTRRALFGLKCVSKSRRLICSNHYGFELVMEKRTYNGKCEGKFKVKSDLNYKSCLPIVKKAIM